MRSSNRSRRHLRHRVEDLELSVNFLALLSRALMQVLMVRGDLKKKDFTKLMKQIDRVDGEADGGLDLNLLAAELDVVILEPKKKKAKRKAAAKARTTKKAKSVRKKRR